MSATTAVHSRERSRWGHHRPSFIAEDRRIPGKDEKGYTFIANELGEWVHYAFGIRAASDVETADGFIRVYVNDDLALPGSAASVDPIAPSATATTAATCSATTTRPTRRPPST